jgi:NAD(P)-dependent dehydrogenase (short-subunit alcohol dehydrogenase family)
MTGPVFITGAASGIGLACAQAFAAAGSPALLVGRRIEALESARAALPGSGHEVLGVDAADEPALTEGVGRFVESAGPLSCGVFCAGAHMVRPLAVSKAEHFARQFEANVVTAAVCAKVFSRHVSKDGGAIVFVSSAAAIRGGATVSAYSAAKSGLLGLARSLELAPRRIRVNAVLPGVVRTPMTERFFGTLTAAQTEAIAANHLLGLGEPADVAAAICFLAGDGARWITGTELVVDGGLTCK